MLHAAKQSTVADTRCSVIRVALTAAVLSQACGCNRLIAISLITADVQPVVTNHAISEAIFRQLRPHANFIFLNKEINRSALFS